MKVVLYLHTKSTALYTLLEASEDFLKLRWGKNSKLRHGSSNYKFVKSIFYLNKNEVHIDFEEVCETAYAPCEHIFIQGQCTKCGYKMEYVNEKN